MSRIRISPAPLAAALLAWTAGAAFAGAGVSLRPAPVSHGADITLGDLFEGAGPAAGVVVAEAAPAGSQTVLEAGRVQTLARRAGLDWANPIGQRRVIVTTAGAPPATGAGRDFTRTAFAPPPFTLAPFTLAPFTPAPIASARPSAYTRGPDPARPRVIRRDDLVQVTFEDGGISLTLQAKATGDAAVGEALQLINPQSKKLVDAVAAAPGRALVGPAAEALKAQIFETNLRLAAR